MSRNIENVIKISEQLLYWLTFDITWPYHVTGSALSVVERSGLLYRRSDGLELATGQSPRPGAQQQQLQTIAENEPISSLYHSAHSALEMLYDFALYKSIVDCAPW